MVGDVEVKPIAKLVHQGATLEAQDAVQDKGKPQKETTSEKRQRVQPYIAVSRVKNNCTWSSVEAAFALRQAAEVRVIAVVLLN